ncbi:FAD-dependent oxidoreductase [Yoonia sp. GPGPB17]|uniref:NAD(P)/FAD-dependent oxidoreductase n=1 Tax=Yoonia sp. GPGPB17 TaxID=3026147 RepID=UPI0030C357D6
MTEQSFDVIVVGAGLMGSAAARHLAEMGVKTALVGPAEPEVKAAHTGVFASHYDQARITRKIDARKNWSRFSQAAIKRYEEIEEKGGVSFFSAVGAIIAGPEVGDGSDFILNARRNAVTDGVAHEALRGAALAARFTDFAFPEGILALYEPSEAGWINPRAHVRAEIAAARSTGAYILCDEVVRITEEHGEARVVCAGGDVLAADKVVVACGAFSKSEGLLPDPIPTRVYARTIAFFELDAEEAARLAGMPSVVYLPPDLSADPYILPPVRYPDGKTYIKIGGDAVDRELGSVAEMIDWFRSGGDPSAGAAMADILTGLMPGLRYHSVSFDSCVTSFSPNGNPFIYPQSDCIIALTAGNGAGAKCADELGRLGALVATGGTIPADMYEGAFAP